MFPLPGFDPDEARREREARFAAMASPPRPTSVGGSVPPLLPRPGAVPNVIEAESSGWLDRAGRLITGILSPVQLPQDLFFGAIAGAIDPSKSVLDYFGEMEWANYGFWNAAPKRNVSGEDLLRLAGVREGRARTVLGVGLDIFADPLLGGTYLRGVGKALKIPELARVANLVDTAAESAMLVGGVPTRRVVQAARVSLPGFARFEQAIHTNIVQKYVVPVLESLPDIRVGGKLYSPAGMVAVDGGRMAGAQEAISRVAGVSDEVAENVMVALMQADAAAGGTWWQTALRNHQRSMGVMYDIPIQQMNQFPPEVTRAIMNAASTTGDDLGYLLARNLGMPGVRQAGFAPARSPRMAQAISDIEGIEHVASRVKLRPKTAVEMGARANAYNRQRQALMDVATKYGADPQAVGNAFDTVITKLQQVSALEGYFASGYAPLRDRFTQRLAGFLSQNGATNPALLQAVQKAGGEARVVRNAWNDLIRYGIDNLAETAIDWKVRFPGANLLPVADVPTYRQLFGEFANVPNLNLGTYFNKLPRGHLRRSFGMFQDGESWRLMTERVRDGRVASTRILNEQPVYQGLLGRGFKQEADVLREYLDDILPRTRGRPVGAYVTQQEVVEHMARKGMDPARVEHFWREMLDVADPHIKKLADEMATYGAQRVGNVNLGADVLRTPRENLSQPELEVLFELMNPMLSAAETSVAAGKSLRKTESLSSLARLAEQQGLVLDSASAAGRNAPKWWRRVPLDQQAALPMLAGKTVHPTVYREFANAVRLGARGNERGLFAGLQQVRSLITAGYLANPATTTANVAGGFWTAAMFGINPKKLLDNMTEVYRDWKRLGRELPELAHMRDIVSAGVSQSDLIRFADDIGSGGMGLREGAGFFGKTWYDASRRYMEFLKRPLGSRQSGALGLGAFEASEALFRLGTFRMVMKETAGDVAKARQMARFVVFDYAAQPGAVQLVRDTGIFLFPAFPYFMVGRTLTAATQRPGLLAAAERLPEAIGKLVVPDEGDRRRMLMGMEDWMMDDKYIPIRQQANGDVTMLSLNQLMPTNTLTGAPFSDSLKSLGLWGPMIDIVTAITALNKPYGDEDPGRGKFTGDYGRRVLPSGTKDWSDPATVVGGLLSFIHNSFAPGLARKLVRAPEDIEQEWAGFVPKLLDAATPAPAEWSATGRTARELVSRRADQDLFDAAISLAIRSTRNVATRGPLADGPRILERATTDLQRQLTQLDRRISLLAAEGNEPALREAIALRERATQRFMERWGDYIRELRTMASSGVFQPPAPGR